MKERPILMHARSINAILEGRKTQTRRIVKPQPNLIPQAAPVDNGTVYTSGWFEGGPVPEYVLARCPYGQPGDRLWVREQFSALESFDFFNPEAPDEIPEFWYWADGNPKWGDWTKPKPSIHMPRWASRLTLEVTGIRVERVQDISGG